MGWGGWYRRSGQEVRRARQTGLVEHMGSKEQLMLKEGKTGIILVTDGLRGAGGERWLRFVRPVTRSKRVPWVEKEAGVCGHIMSCIFCWVWGAGGTSKWKHPTAGNLELEAWKEVGTRATDSGDKSLEVSPGCALAPEGSCVEQEKTGFGEGAYLGWRRKKEAVSQNKRIM